MEALFNAVWGLVAASLALAYMRQRESRQIWLRLLALACMLVLLFPVISITDDLHSSQDLFDDISSRKTLHSIDRIRTTTPALFVVPTSATILAAPSIAWAVLTGLDPSEPSTPALAGRIARAPPALL